MREHKSKVSLTSNIFTHSDFEECNRAGTIFKADQSNYNTKIQENDMENNVNYIGGEYKIAKVRYINGGGVYNFKADIDLPLEEGTLVVVEARNGLGLAEVIGVLENCIDNAEESNCLDC